MGRVLVHGEKASELVFGDRADRIDGHVRLPTKRTPSRPLLIARDCILVKRHRSASRRCATSRSTAPVHPSHKEQASVTAGTSSGEQPYFDPDGWEDFFYWLGADRKIAVRITR
jgi:hypothetical protein